MVKKDPKSRNHVVKKMIQRSQKAGYHPDEKKENDKTYCREDLDLSEWDEDEDEEEEE